MGTFTHRKSAYGVGRYDERRDEKRYLGELRSSEENQRSGEVVL
jgi:hypothetical protein